MAQNKTTGQMALALQGGGSHGAFTWGVLHALLDDERIDWPRIAAISGTSAGAVNAAVMSVGYVSGDAKSARRNAQEALATFWQDVSVCGEINPFKPLRIKGVPGAPTNGSSNKLLDWWSDATRSYWQQFSPYQTNPLNLNPLRELLSRHISTKALKKFRDADLWSLHLAATEVSSGQPKFFTDDEVNVETLMASACLPMVFQAVEIEGKHYWDGGYSANPPLAPLVQDSRVDAIVLVALSATRREGLPQSAADITERERDISFAAPLNAEQRMWHAVAQRLKNESEKAAHNATTLPTLEVISSRKFLNQLDAASKLDTDAAFLNALFEAGKSTTEKWLKDPPQI
jgi:NTE family protein